MSFLLNAPDQQTDKTSALIEVLTLSDDQLISALISSTWLLLTLLIPVEAVRVHLVFYKPLVHFSSVFCISVQHVSMLLFI